MLGSVLLLGFVLFALGEVSGVWSGKSVDDALHNPPLLETADSGDVTDATIAESPVKKHKIIPLSPPPPRPDVGPTVNRSADTMPPAIVLVIDDLGLNAAAAMQIADLPGPLTMAFLPYANDLEHQTGLALAAGHELLVHLPMEPKGRDADPGPMALLSGLSDQELIARLEWNLSRFDGFVGVNNHMGSRLTEDRRAMTFVMDALERRDLLFLDSRTTSSSVAERLAESRGIPHLSRDVFLDNDPSVHAVLERLEELERIAKHTGLAVGIGHPYPETIEALTDWLPQMEARGFVLTPLSQAAERPGYASLKHAVKAP